MPLISTRPFVEPPIVLGDRTLVASTGGLWVNDTWGDIGADQAGSQVTGLPWGSSLSGAWTNLEGTTILRAGNSIYTTTNLSTFTESSGTANGLGTGKVTQVCWSDYHSKWFWMGAVNGDNTSMKLLSSEDGIAWTTVFTGKPGGFNFGDTDRLAVDDQGRLAYTCYTYGTPANPVFFSLDGGVTWGNTTYTFATTLAQRIENMAYIEDTWWAYGQYSKIFQSGDGTPGESWTLVHVGGGQFDEARQLIYGNGEIFKTEEDSTDVLSVATKTGPGTWSGWTDRDPTFYSGGGYSMGFDPRTNEFGFASGTVFRRSTTNWNSEVNPGGSWGALVVALYTKVIV